jgi:UDP-N-acetylmuramoyl-tripeptide--D-alanyl-D-alanine ligase
VTGSNGKTTTKEMIAAVLSAGGAKVAKSRGTENNLVGLPHTILRLSGDEDYAVLEMGMNHPGEIWRLAEIARPDVGVITNVAPAHLEGVGSLANVAAAKEELALGLAPAGVLIVNATDPRLVAIADRFAGRKVLVGGNGPLRALSSTPTRNGQTVEVEVEGRRASVELGIRGSHNVENALLAIAAGFALGVDLDAALAGLATFTPPAMRLQVVLTANGARILNDAYNANPASMEAALAVLAAEPGRRKLAVLGEMWELGAEAARYHREVGAAAARARVDGLLAVGRYGVEMAAGAVEAGLPSALAECCESAAEAATRLASRLGEGDVVLVKGSRGAKMEEIVARLGRG